MVLAIWAYTRFDTLGLKARPKRTVGTQSGPKTGFQVVSRLFGAVSDQTLDNTKVLKFVH